MKKVLFALLCVFTLGVSAQEKYVDRNAIIKIESNAEVDDDVRVVNSQVAAILIPSQEQIAFQVLIKGFEFKKALMQEHFNENYMESDKYPKARFQGKIKNYKDLDIESASPKKVIISGEMEIRGIKKPFSAEAMMYMENGRLILDSEFLITLADFGISIPSVVSDKISKQFDVKVHAELSK